MASAQRYALSGGASGKGILVTATGSTGTTIHAAVAGSATPPATFDEVWLWAVNTDTTPIKLTLQYGGTTSPDNDIEQTIPPESGLVLLVPGLILFNSTTLYAYAGTGSKIVVYGYVNRVTN